MPTRPRRVALVLLLAAASACRRSREPVRAADPAPAPPAEADARAADAATSPGAAAGTPALPVAPPPGPPPAGAKTVALLHTANVRGQLERLARPPHGLGGLDRRAALHAALARKGLATLAVDGGDLLVPAPGEVRYLDDDPAERERRAQLLLAAAARLGVQAIVPGETDLALGARRLAELARKAKVPFVCANLTDAGAPLFQPARVARVAGVAIGIFGLLDPPAADREALQKEGLALAPLEEAAARAVESLRAQGAAVVVGLFHVEGGAARAAAVTAAVPGIDVVVLGHEGTLTGTPLAQGETRLVEAGRYGKRVGQLDLHVTPEGTQIGAHQVHALDGSLTPDGPMAALVSRHVRERNERAARGLIATVDPRLANTQAPLPRKGAPARPPLTEHWTYGSTAGCIPCHAEEAEQWKGTSHAFSMQSIVRHGREGDPECLQCHSTAFLRPGGTRSLATARTYFPEVGCESCHGPSVAHVVAGNKKTGTRLQADVAECRFCHPTDRAETAYDVAAELRHVLGPGHGL